MKAVVQEGFGGVEVMKYKTDYEKPVAGSNQILVKVYAAGVNPIDTYIRQDGSAFNVMEANFVPGQDFAGVVEESSPETIDKYPVGTSVWVCKNEKYGGYAEYAVATPGSDMVGIMTPNMTMEQGAAMGIPYLTACIAIKKMAKVKPGQVVAISGASGGVGMAACDILNSMGCTVFATVGTKTGEENVNKCGVKHIYYHNEEGYVEKMIKDAVEFGGIDAVIENAAHISLTNSLTMVKPDGYIAIIGAKSFHNTNTRLILAKQINVSGVFLFHNPIPELEECVEFVENMCKKNQIHQTIVTFPLSQAQEAHTEIITPKTGGATGKIVLKV